MRFQTLLLLLVIPASLYGQKTGNSSSVSDTHRASNQKSAADSGDIINFLVQSQIVEFKTSLNRDPFDIPTTAIKNTNGSFSIDEITIQGWAVIRKKPFALILDPHHNIMEIPIGFKFLDGELTAITENALVFIQWDANSPTRSSMRTVTKPFRREEEK